MFLSNNEPLFIDVDRMAVGDPIVDLSSMYLFYVGYAELDPKIIEDFMGISVKTAAAFYHSFIRQYLKTDDETELEKTVRSASLWAFVRLIGQIKKKPLSEKDKRQIREQRSTREPMKSFTPKQYKITENKKFNKKKKKQYDNHSLLSGHLCQ